MPLWANAGSLGPAAYLREGLEAQYAACFALSVDCILVVLKRIEIAAKYLSFDFAASYQGR